MFLARLNATARCAKSSARLLAHTVQGAQAQQRFVRVVEARPARARPGPLPPRRPEAPRHENVAQPIDQETSRSCWRRRRAGASACRRNRRGDCATRRLRLGRFRSPTGQKSRSTRTTPCAARRRPKGSLLARRDQADPKVASQRASLSIEDTAANAAVSLAVKRRCGEPCLPLLKSGGSALPDRKTGVFRHVAALKVDASHYPCNSGNSRTMSVTRSALTERCRRGRRSFMSSARSSPSPRHEASRGDSGERFYPA